MADVSIRDLRNHGGDVVDRVQNGERITVTRAGRPVAELRPLETKGVSREQLINRRKHLPVVDPRKLRDSVDSILDPSL